MAVQITCLLFFLSHHLLIAIWVIATFYYLWIMLLWTFLCKFFYGYMFSIPWELAMEFLGLVNCLTFLVNFFTAKVFPKWAHRFTFPKTHEGPNFTISLTTLGHLRSFFREMRIQNLCSFKNRFVFLFLNYISLYILTMYMICKYFFPFCKLSFHSLNSILGSKNNLWFWCSSVFLFFGHSRFWVSGVQKPPPKPRSWTFTPAFF